MTPNHAITDNIHFASKQAPMTINNTNQQVIDNIDLAKKQMQTINRTTKNWLKVENKEVVYEEFPPYIYIYIFLKNTFIHITFGIIFY